MSRARCPDRIDILPGSRIVRDGRRWRADVTIDGSAPRTDAGRNAGPWRVKAEAVASSPGTAAHRALELAWLGVLAQWRKETEAA